ncbi:hypothetical protein ACYZX9_07155 [Sphingomonas citri]|jgi:hypothetical protein|uniref:Uncharacterized protein n=1 Tax=Sphingomonas citri TaxID=2862499 RepID=A0ABS7BN24_9SPHN|nr:hypothetical protein [Sphingomonas citri]MBW6531009.1 hypothetical protein [Sphingomonas citri]
MKKIVAGATGICLALALAACGSKTSNDTAANDTLANETVLNEELPTEGNFASVGNGTDLGALPANATGDNVSATAGNTL